MVISEMIERAEPDWKHLFGKELRSCTCFIGCSTAALGLGLIIWCLSLNDAWGLLVCLIWGGCSALLLYGRIRRRYYLYRPFIVANVLLSVVLLPLSIYLLIRGFLYCEPTTKSYGSDTYCYSLKAGVVMFVVSLLQCCSTTVVVLDFESAAYGDQSKRRVALNGIVNERSLDVVL